MSDAEALEKLRAVLARACARAAQAPRLTLVSATPKPTTNVEPPRQDRPEDHRP